MTKRVSQNEARRVVQQQLAREKRRRRRMWTAIIAAAAVVLAGLIGWGIYSRQASSDYQTPKDAASDATGIRDGAGPVTVDVYLDFMCPHCKDFEQEAGSTLRKLAAENRATVVYHPMAILDAASTNEYSTRSSAASACAADADRFVPYAEALFAHQPAEGGPGLTDDDLVRIAGTVGIVDPAFAQCVRSGTYRSWVTHVTRSAAQRGVTGTPTVYVAGQPLAQPTSATITAAVDAAGK